MTQELRKEIQIKIEFYQQEISPVGCYPSASTFRTFFTMNRFEHVSGGGLYSEVQVQHIRSGARLGGSCTVRFHVPGGGGGRAQGGTRAMRSHVQGSNASWATWNPPPVDRMTDWWTDTTENITFLQLRWRVVKNVSTSMHSSRMRITRLLPISPSMYCAVGVSAPGGLILGGVCSWGVCSCVGGLLSQHALRQTPREQNDWQTGVKTNNHRNFVCGR